MRLLLNTESLRPSLTGIGSYILNLLRQFTKNSMLGQVGCFNGSALLGADEKLRLVGVSPSDEAPEAPARQSVFADGIRKTATFGRLSLRLPIM